MTILITFVSRRVRNRREERRSRVGPGPRTTQKGGPHRLNHHRSGAGICLFKKCGNLGVLAHRFQVAAPNRVWGSDVTACWTAQGWLYLAVVLDLASRRVIGWATGATPGQELTLPALRQALTHRTPPAGLLHHSDRGMHYTGSSYQRLLATHGGIASMSRRGNCWANAVVESFFATLKTELVADAQWQSHSDATDALRQYIAWYNGQRLHSTLGYLSPARFERQLTAA